MFGGTTRPDAVNRTYRAGAMIGSTASRFFFNPQVLPADTGWRLAFFIGPILGSSSSSSAAPSLKARVGS
jgi:hypothetical protein